MKISPKLFLTILSSVFGVIFVFLVFPRSGGFWTNTFFEIPYPLAFIFVPVASGGVTYLSYLLLQNIEPFSVGSYYRNIVTTIMAFYLYGALHAVVVGIFNNYEMAALIFLNFLMFGSLLILPVCVLITVVATRVTNTTTFSNNAN